MELTSAVLGKGSTSIGSSRTSTKSGNIAMKLGCVELKLCDFLAKYFFSLGVVLIDPVVSVSSVINESKASKIVLTDQAGFHVLG